MDAGTRRWGSEGPPRRARAPVVGLVGGRGGAGASVVAAVLARVAAERRRACVLLDADPLGGGIDVLLGAEDEPGLRWPDLSAARGAVPAQVLLDGLPLVDGILVVTWDRGAPEPVPAAAVEAVAAAAAQQSDLVVVDCPRGLGEPATAALSVCDLVMLVVPADVRGVTSAIRVAAVATDACEDVRVLVRPAGASGLSDRAVADALGLPLAGRIRTEPGLAVALDRGEPPGLRRRGPLASACRDLLDLIEQGRPG